MKVIQLFFTCCICCLAFQLGAQETAGRTPQNSVQRSKDKFSVTLKDDTILVGVLRTEGAKFDTSFASVDVAADDILSFTNDFLVLGDGTKLRGRFQAGKLTVEASIGNVELPFESIASIAKPSVAESKDSAPVRTPPKLTWRNDAPPDVVEIIEKAIAAHGGMEVLARFNNRKTVSTVTATAGAGQSYIVRSTHSVEIPGKLRLDQEIIHPGKKPIRNSFSVNGDEVATLSQSSSLFGRKANAQGEIMLREDLHTIESTCLPYLPDSDFRLTRVATTEEGHASAIKVSKAGKPDVTMMFDKTGLLVGIDMERLSGDKRITKRNRGSDFRNFSGYTAATTWNYSDTDGDTATSKIESIEPLVVASASQTLNRQPSDEAKTQESPASSARPAESTGRKALENQVRTQSNGKIRVVSFTKSNGKGDENYYQLEYDAEIEFLANGAWESRGGGFGSAVTFGFSNEQVANNALAQSFGNVVGARNVRRGQREKVVNVRRGAWSRT